jgi:hypothetical protein
VQYPTHRYPANQWNVMSDSRREERREKIKKGFWTFILYGIVLMGSGAVAQEFAIPSGLAAFLGAGVGSGATWIHVKAL